MIALLVLSSTACGPKNIEVTATDSLGRFVEDAKNTPAPEPENEGSLWVGHGRQSNLFRDFKARQINDIVTIRVYEKTTARATADAESGREMEMEAGFSKLFGLEKGIKELPELVAGKGSSTFQGQGSTSRDTALSTTISARVKDVLPNGYLVLEGVREVRLNDENQTVYITGVVRPEDITASNMVSSSSIAELAVRVEGRGVVSQPLRPGLLYRILNSVLPF
jgi:flagellar L-ring protein precursor FlgH